MTLLANCCWVFLEGHSSLWHHNHLSWRCQEHWHLEKKAAAHLVIRYTACCLAAVVRNFPTAAFTTDGTADCPLGSCRGVISLQQSRARCSDPHSTSAGKSISRGLQTSLSSVALIGPGGCGGLTHWTEPWEPNLPRAEEVTLGVTCGTVGPREVGRCDGQYCFQAESLSI